MKHSDKTSANSAQEKNETSVLFAIASVVLLLTITAYSIATKGFTYVKDNLIGHPPTKELLESEWVKKVSRVILV
jgi:hypothetical protein